MGGSCSAFKEDPISHVEKDTQDLQHSSSRLVKKPHYPQRTAPFADGPRSKLRGAMTENQYDLVGTLDEVLNLKSRLGASDGGGEAKRRRARQPMEKTVLEGADFWDAGLSSPEEEYFRQREQLMTREKALAFDFYSSKNATELQNLADRVLQAVRLADNENVYKKAKKRSGYGGQTHARFCGDHFLSNVELIEETKLFAIARKLPKGAHLHIHFNANLTPDVLINIAKQMPCMYISSDSSLAPALTARSAAADECDNFEMCKLQFHLLSDNKVAQGKRASAEQVSKTEENRRALWLGDIFDEEYPNEPEVSLRPRMKFNDFRAQFSSHYPEMNVDEFLQNKLVFREEEAHNHLQTAHGAWEKFNTRTQMMKGLFNYVQAYEEYTLRCLKEFVDDNIQYAEIRPNFMKANQLWSNDGTEQIDNRGIMNIIFRVYERFQKNHPEFGGLKVIYCTPRSSCKEDVALALKECLKFKQEWPEWIAGFDLLGEETEGHALTYFVPELLQFKRDCKAANVDIPFLFHCGETLEVGGPTDGNLLDALLLGSKRIGHGFSLDRHPYILEQMKKKNICMELCPISNEILGLTSRVGGHSMYSLLARNVHCTVSTDNGTLFRSRLSHDFYQVMAGSEDMSLHGWRQLIEWSIEHSCMEAELMNKIRLDWEVRWNDFCRWIIATYQEEYEKYGGKVDQADDR